MSIFEKIRKALSLIGKLPRAPVRWQKLVADVNRASHSAEAMRREIDDLKDQLKDTAAMLEVFGLLKDSTREETQVLRRSLEVIPALKEEVGLLKATARYEMDVLKSNLHHAGTGRRVRTMEGDHAHPRGTVGNGLRRHVQSTPSPRAEVLAIDPLPDLRETRDPRRWRRGEHRDLPGPGRDPRYADRVPQSARARALPAQRQPAMDGRRHRTGE